MSGNDSVNKDLTGKTKGAKSKLKKTSLVKKLANLKRHKVNPKKDDVEDDTISQTSLRSLLKQKTIGRNLSNSSPSFRITKSSEKLNTDVDDDDVSSITSMVSHNNIELPHSKPLNIDLTDQITASEGETSIRTYNNIQQIIESSRDKVPAILAPSVPYHITEEEVTSLINYNLSQSIDHNSITSSTGTIKKDLEQLKARKRLSREEFFEPIESMKPTEIPIPKPIRRKSTDKNESRRKSIDPPSFILQKPVSEESLIPSTSRKASVTPGIESTLEETSTTSEIKFDIGTIVRPQKIIQVRRGSNLLHPADDYSSLDIPKSESSIDSDFFRRKVPFAAQTTGGSDEKDYLNTPAEETEHPSYLSVLSDLSIESEYLEELEGGMAPHGDLITPDMPQEEVMVSFYAF